MLLLQIFPVCSRFCMVFSPCYSVKKKRRTGILCSSPNLTLTPVILWWFFQVQLHVWDLLPVGKDLFHRIPEVLQTGMGCSSCAILQNRMKSVAGVATLPFAAELLRCPRLLVGL